MKFIKLAETLKKSKVSEHDVVLDAERLVVVMKGGKKDEWSG